MKTHFKYIFQAFQKDHFWLPPAIMGLFMIILAFMPPADQYNGARAFLGFVLPLLSGGLAAYAFLEDSALELRFATRRSMWKLILERLGIVLAVSLVVSLAFQLYVQLVGISLAPLGGLAQRQLVWFIPCLTLLLLGGTASLLSRNSGGGIALVGGLWIIQLLLKGWFAEQPIWRNLLLFYSVMDPLSEACTYNQLTLGIISLLLLGAAYWLLTKQERYI